MSSSAASALVWLLIPIVAVFCAIVYGVWISKYKSKFDNQTSRSVNNFKKFQNTFRPKN
jgi:hypothetical protein